MLPRCGVRPLVARRKAMMCCKGGRRAWGGRCGRKEAAGGAYVNCVCFPALLADDVLVLKLGPRAEKCDRHLHQVGLRDARGGPSGLLGRLHCHLRVRRPGCARSSARASPHEATRVAPCDATRDALPRPATRPATRASRPRRARVACTTHPRRAWLPPATRPPRTRDVPTRGARRDPRRGARRGQGTTPKQRIFSPANGPI